MVKNILTPSPLLFTSFFDFQLPHRVSRKILTRKFTLFAAACHIRRLVIYSKHFFSNLSRVSEI
jgi:hypothetical protein